MKFKCITLFKIRFCCKRQALQECRTYFIELEVKVPLASICAGQINGENTDHYLSTLTLCTVGSLPLWQSRLGQSLDRT